LASTGNLFYPRSDSSGPDEDKLKSFQAAERERSQRRQAAGGNHAGSSRQRPNALVLLPNEIIARVIQVQLGARSVLIVAKRRERMAALCTKGCAARDGS
jgi:hypothetical protein